MTDEDVTSETIAAYIQTLDAQGVERDLERLYGSEENTRIGRDLRRRLRSFAWINSYGLKPPARSAWTT